MHFRVRTREKPPPWDSAGPDRPHGSRQDLASGYLMEEVMMARCWEF